VLRSLSRSAPDAYEPAERRVVERAKRLIRAYADTAELIQLGAYRRGSNPLIDAAIAVRPALEAVLGQQIDERSALADDFARLTAAVDAAETGAAGV
jgi:flagellum-specific ATP synthase